VKPERRLEDPRLMEVVDPDSRHKRTLSGRSIAEDLRLLLASPIGRTLDGFLFELANLELLADANSSPELSEGGKSADVPIPSFRSVWAARKRDQVESRMWAEKEHLAGFLSRPFDPQVRNDLCLSCGQKFSREDICCRHCGRQLRQVDEL
jgi:hypothetical protein